MIGLARHPAVFYPGAAAAVGSALYLAWANLQAFLIGANLDARADEFGLGFVNSFVFFCGAYVIGGLRDRTYLWKGEFKPGWFAAFLVVNGFVALFGVAFLWFLYVRLPSSALLPLVVEVLSLTVLVAQDRHRIFARQGLLFAFWSGSFLAGANAIALCEAAGLPPLGTKATLAYCAILYHLLNAGYLFRAAFLKPRRQPGRRAGRMRGLRRTAAETSDTSAPTGKISVKVSGRR